MKKIIFLLCLFSARHALTQESQSISYVNTSHRQHGVVTLYTDAINMAAFINNVNPRAARNLLKTFKDANNIQWKIDNQEITAYFTKNEIQTKVRYDKNGNRISIRKVYSGNKLDEFISSLAKKDFDWDFSIYGVTEVTSDAGKVYEIILQNKYYWGVVKIAEDNQGELERLGEAEVFLKV